MYFCESCGEHCSPVVHDEGIGAYEFWGADGVDTNEQLYSDCCEATVVSSTGCAVTASEYAQDRAETQADYEHDCRRDAQWEDEQDGTVH